MKPTELSGLPTQASLPPVIAELRQTERVGLTSGGLCPRAPFLFPFPPQLGDPLEAFPVFKKYDRNG